ncbi:MAG TPA: hypothetical protein PLY93_02915 [Turneriella sp.]|nr:hypothetical protein [Turneriella sp.]
MNFRIRSITPESLILQQTKGFVLVRVIFKIFALILLGAGALFVLGEPQNTVAYMLLGFGIFLWGASDTAKNFSRQLPAKLIFDNQAGLLRFIQRVRKKNIETVAVSYAEIADFKTITRRQDRVVRYFTALEWQDDSLLLLCSHNTQKKANEEVLKFRASIALHKKSEPVVFTPPVRVQEKSLADKTVFTWRFDFFNPKNRTTYLAVVSFSGVLVALGFQLDILGKILAFAASGVILGIPFCFALRWVGAEGVFEIDKHEIRYWEKRGPKTELKHSILLRELERVWCVALGRSNDMAVYLLKKEEYELYLKIIEGEIAMGDIISALQILYRSFKIYTPQLNFSERFRFAWCIRKIVTELRK